MEPVASVPCARAAFSHTFPQTHNPRLKPAHVMQVSLSAPARESKRDLKGLSYSESSSAQVASACSEGQPQMMDLRQGEASYCNHHKPHRKGKARKGKEAQDRELGAGN